MLAARAPLVAARSSSDTLGSGHETTLRLSPQVQLRATRPFGGIQLILCGDFFQLPPIGLSSGKIAFLFECRCWASVLDDICVLTEVFRQKEGAFVRLLNEMRRGELSPFHESLLARLAHNVQVR